MLLDSVFDPLLFSPFEDDQPEIPMGRITADLNRIERSVDALMLDAIGDKADDLIRRAQPLMRVGDVQGIAALESSLNIEIQRHIYRTWEDSWTLGGIHGGEEMERVAGFGLNLTRTTLINSPARDAVLNRAVMVAGSFSTDTINQFKADMIASIVPQAGGDPITRKELRERLTRTLNVSEVRAGAIARTETTAAYGTGRLTTYKESPLVTHVRYISIIDNQTTDICRSRQGLIIPIEESANYAPPNHVRCRAVLSPILPAVNKRHQEYLEDDRRNPANRKLTPLPKGWRTASASEPSQPQKPDLSNADWQKLKIDGIDAAAKNRLYQAEVNGQRYFAKQVTQKKVSQEVISSDIAAQMGLKEYVPQAQPVTINKKPAVATPFVEGKSLDQGGDRLAIKNLSDRDASRIISYDYLIGNPDRHSGNVLIGSGGKVTLIDHDAAFTTDARFKPGAPRADRDLLNRSQVSQTWLGEMYQSTDKGVGRARSLSVPREDIESIWQNREAIAARLDENKLSGKTFLSRLDRLYRCDNFAQLAGFDPIPDSVP